MFSLLLTVNKDLLSVKDKFLLSPLFTASIYGNLLEATRCTGSTWFSVCSITGNPIIVDECIDGGLCSRKDSVEALELLGCALIKHRRYDDAIFYWKQSIQERWLFATRPSRRSLVLNRYFALKVKTLQHLQTDMHQDFQKRQVSNQGVSRRRRPGPTGWESGRTRLAVDTRDWTCFGHQSPVHNESRQRMVCIPVFLIKAKTSWSTWAASKQSKPTEYQLFSKPYRNKQITIFNPNDFVWPLYIFQVQRISNETKITVFQSIWSSKTSSNPCQARLSCAASMRPTTYFISSCCWL